MAPDIFQQHRFSSQLRAPHQPVAASFVYACLGVQQISAVNHLLPVLIFAAASPIATCSYPTSIWAILTLFDPPFCRHVHDMHSRLLSKTDV